MGLVADPPLEAVLEFCAQDPVERVFLEEMARRGTKRFTALERDGAIVGLCHAGTNVVPSGAGTDAFADIAVASGARMLIGEEQAVGRLWAASARRLPAVREDRPGQPVYVISEPPEPGETGLRPATPADLPAVLPRAAAAHREELGLDPLQRDPDGFRLRTRVQIEEGRSWVWLENGEVRFKAEASAWTPSAVQLAQVWSDPGARGRGYAQRALRDLVCLLLESVPTVTLFVRTENAPAIRLYERIGMRRALSYRSVLF